MRYLENRDKERRMFMEREIKPGQVYRHFKGTVHKIICIAKHSEKK